MYQWGCRKSADAATSRLAVFLARDVEDTGPVRVVYGLLLYFEDPVAGLEYESDGFCLLLPQLPWQVRAVLVIVGGACTPPELGTELSRLRLWRALSVGENMGASRFQNAGMPETQVKTCRVFPALLFT